MLPPIRCFTCNKVLGNKYELFNKLKEAKVEMKTIFKELGLTRYCCKMCISTSVDLSDKMIQYNSITENVKQLKPDTNKKRYYTAR